MVGSSNYLDHFSQIYVTPLIQKINTKNYQALRDKKVNSIRKKKQLLYVLVIFFLFFFYVYLIFIHFQMLWLV